MSMGDSIFVCKNTYEKTQKILTFSRLLVFEISLKYLDKNLPQKLADHNHC